MLQNQTILLYKNGRADCAGADVDPGQRFSKGVSADALKSWAESL